jgi:hypothetical protein
VVCGEEVSVFWEGFVLLPVLDRACGRGRELGVMGLLLPCGGRENVGGVRILPSTGPFSGVP